MRHRHMFNATGQPGWMRLGYSPGWANRGGQGLGPCAQLLLGGLQSAGAVPPATKEARAQALRVRAEALASQLEALQAEIDALERG